MSTDPQSPRDDVDDLFGLARRGLRHGWVGALIAVIGIATVVGVALWRPRTYQSRTVLVYRDLIPADVLFGRDQVAVDRDMATRYREMLLSRPMLEPLIEEYGLYPDLIEKAGMAAALEHMREQITFRARGGGTFHILFRGTSRDRAQRVTEQLATRLIEWERRLQVERNTATTRFLQQQWEDAEQELDAREAGLAQFLSEHPEFADEVVTVTGAGGASVRARARKSQKQPVEDGALRALERQRNRVRSQLAGRPQSTEPERVDPSEAERRAETDVANARRELDAVLRDLNALSALYTQQHPDVVAARGRVRTARERLRRAEDRAVAARTIARASAGRRAAPVQAPSPERAERLRAELRRLDGAIARSKRSRGDKESNPTVAMIVELETDWARLHREVQQARERYDDLKTKAFTAAIMESSRSAPGAQLSILDPASRPTRPLGPSNRLVVLAAALLFGGLGAAVSILLGALDDRIVQARDVERLGLGSLLGSVPGRRR